MTPNFNSLNTLHAIAFCTAEPSMARTERWLDEMEGVNTPITTKTCRPTVALESDVNRMMSVQQNSVLTDSTIDQCARVFSIYDLGSFHLGMILIAIPRFPSS